MSGGRGGGEVAVFLHSNLGTRIAFNTHPHITAAALKRDFEKVHFTCLPDAGEIQVSGLMVKRKSWFYYLPDSFPVKYAFSGMRRTWFLHVEVRRSECSHVPCLPSDAVIPSKPQDARTCSGEDKARCKSKEKRTESFHENCLQNTGSRMPTEDKPTTTTYKSRYWMPEIEVKNPVTLCANSIQGSLSKMSTQVMSVTGIINKYFPGSNRIGNVSSSTNSDVTSKPVRSKTEVQSKARAKSCLKIKTMPHFTSKTRRDFHAPLHVKFDSRKSGDKNTRSKIGKRLLVASQSLGVSPTKRSPSLSICKLKDRNLLEYNSQINGSIFSISDSDN